MNVLSLFDGMSCGRIALERCGLIVDKYFASEIDKYASIVSSDNWSDIIRLGDVTKIDYSKLPSVDLLIAGSPCQGFSFAGKQLNFNDARSSLFFEFVKALKITKPKYFLLENVKMKKEYQDIISELLGVYPIEINSSLVSAQNRKRLYWTNIPEVNQPKDKKIYLKDIIDDGITDRHKDLCLDANYFKGGNLKQYFEKHRRQLVFSKDELYHVGDADLKGNESIKRVYHPEDRCPTLTTMGGGHREPKILTGNFCVKEKSQTILATIYKENPKSMIKRKKMGLLVGNDTNYLKWRKLTVLECKRLQTVPDDYKMNVSNTQAYKMLGNGWTVDVIVHILSFINKSQE
jgi:DNA-cytosine methyltransferase